MVAQAMALAGQIDQAIKEAEQIGNADVRAPQDVFNRAVVAGRPGAKVVVVLPDASGQRPRLVAPRAVGTCWFERCGNHGDAAQLTV